MEPEVAYLASKDSNGVGNAWSKIFQEGNTGIWAVEKLLSNKGLVNFLGVPDRWPCSLSGFI